MHPRLSTTTSVLLIDFIFGYSVHRLLVVAASLVDHGLSSAGSVVVACGLSCSEACGIFLDQGSNPCPLHWQADSYLLDHQGNSTFSFLLSMGLRAWDLSSDCPGSNYSHFVISGSGQGT